MIFYSNSKTDRTNTSFGEGLYLYSNKDLAISFINGEECEIIEYEIENDVMNSRNTKRLSVEDYVFFVLYNLGKLEKIENEDFYDRYASFKDGKDFIIGPAMNPVVMECFDRFIKGDITDHTLINLLKKHVFDTQILVSSLETRKKVSLKRRRVFCKDSIVPVKTALHSIHNNISRMFNQDIKDLSIQRKGLYFTEVIDEINSGTYSLNKF